MILTPQQMAESALNEREREQGEERMNEELTKLMTDSYDQGVKDALESIKEGLDALPKREWVGLTDDEVMEMMGYDKQYGHIPQYARNFVEAISAKLKEKNT